MSVKRAILAASLVVLLVAGCSKLVDGRAVVAVPPPGSPIRWGPCESTDPQTPIPPEAECGKLSVPVDYSKPDGEVAQLAMIRFKATGDKIKDATEDASKGLDKATEEVGKKVEKAGEKIQDAARK